MTVLLLNVCLLSLRLLSELCSIHVPPKCYKNKYATIVRAFKKCSITNELDGTEDDILWQDDRDAPCADSDNEREEMYDDMLTESKC